MITDVQREYIENHGYVPEHIPPYVTAISQTEPYLYEDFLVYAREGHLIFIGYPFKEPFDEEKMTGSLNEWMKRFKLKEVSLTAPAIPSSFIQNASLPSDDYYRLDLGKISIPQKTRNMISRAKQELVFERDQTLGEDHRKLIDQFLDIHPVDEATRFIFKKIPRYVSSSKTAWVFNLRDQKNHLVAFDVAEFGSRQYAMYLFNFRSLDRHVPGASDLLLFELIQMAKQEEKSYINLGLGINPGITFFKKKWGGVPFLHHTFCLYRPSRMEILETLLQKL